MIARLLCWIGLHDWSYWQQHRNHQWLSRECRRCGYIEHVPYLRVK